MGLDMYLYAERYVSRNDYSKYDSRSGEEPPLTPEFQAIYAMLEPEEIKALTNGAHVGAAIDIPIGYWRKANAIHGWIVQNKADGVDECQKITMFRKDLEELLEVCVNARDNRDPNELMPTEGFFFGGYDIDEWYWHDIDLTIQILTDALATKNDYFIYQASW